MISQSNVADTTRTVSVVRGIEPTQARAYVVSAAGIVLVLALAVFAVYRLNPPRPVPVSAPASEFSSERAFKHLSVIAQGPRPAGTSEHAAAANYIQNELRALGLNPEIQQTPTATNILARLKGTVDQKAVLLVGHYDSVAEGPGASDNGAAVVAILETLRALKSSEPLRNDVIALFSDTEELGTLGAKSFVYQHPWTSDIGVVLNFDARGTSGPVIMFETSNNNGWLMKEFATVAPHPAATSVAPVIYALMPNNTDFTIFKEAGFAGLNFAYIIGLDRYHTSLDNLANIDHRSLQHQGSTALALTRHFGNLNLTGIAQQNDIYFDLLNSTMIVYSQAWVLPLAILVCLAFVGIVWIGFKNKHLTGKGLTLGFFVAALSVVAILVIMTPLKGLLRIGVSPAETHFDLVLFIAVAIGVMLVVNAKLGRRIGVLNLIAAGYLWSVILLAATSLFLKGGSYLFTWPLLFNLGAFAVVLAQKKREFVSIRHLVLQVAGVVPGIILFSPLVYLTFVALTLRSAGASVAIAGAMVLLLGPLMPHFAVVTARLKRD